MDTTTKIIIILVVIWLGCGLLGFILTDKEIWEKKKRGEKLEEPGCLCTIGLLLLYVFHIPLVWIIGFVGLAVIVWVFFGILKLIFG